MHCQERNSRRRNSGDARGLAERLRAMAIEVLLHFGRKPAHRVVIEVDRKRQRLKRPAPLDFSALALDIALVLDLHLDLLRDFRGGGRIARDIGIICLWAPKILIRTHFFRKACAYKHRTQSLFFRLDRIALATERFPPGVIDQAQAPTGFRQPQVCVVLA